MVDNDQGVEPMVLKMEVQWPKHYSTNSIEEIASMTEHVSLYAGFPILCCYSRQLLSTR